MFYLGLTKPLKPKSEVIIMCLPLLLHKLTGYDQLAINPNGQPVRPSACNKQTLCERTLAAWQKVPRKAFVAAWTATGYFNNDHFEEGLGMSYEEALRELDQTGLLASVGIRDDYIGCPKVPDRLECCAHEMGLNLSSCLLRQSLLSCSPVGGYTFLAL